MQIMESTNIRENSDTLVIGRLFLVNPLESKVFMFKFA